MVIDCVPRQTSLATGYDTVTCTVCPGFSASRLEPRTVFDPHGAVAVIVTVVLSLVAVLLVTKANTPTVFPGLVVVGFTLILSPTSDDCPVTGKLSPNSTTQASTSILFLR